MAGPWLSPNEVTTNNFPYELPDIAGMRIVLVQLLLQPGVDPGKIFPRQNTSPLFQQQAVFDVIVA